MPSAPPRSRRSRPLGLLALAALAALSGCTRRQLALHKPLAPTGLTATPTIASIELDWNDNSELDLASYAVYRSTTAGGPYLPIATTAATQSDFSDTGALASVTYYYTVTATNLLANESRPATEASAALTTPHQNPDGTLWFTEANQGGTASELFIEELFWGRLVRVVDGTGALLHRDYLIGEDIQSDGLDYQLDANAVTRETTLTILHAAGTAAFDAAFARLDDQLGVIATKAPEGDLPPFSMVPRNAAIGVRFSDVIDPATLGSSTVRIKVGTPPTGHFEARLVIDPNYGAELSGTFFPTRALLDFDVSELESLTSMQQPNGVGLPASSQVNLANVALRFPTKIDPASGQFTVLANPAGSSLATSGNGPIDLLSATQDILRGMRSGGDSDVTGDAFNGFLLDITAPTIIGTQPVTLTSVVPDPAGTAGDFLATFTFSNVTCACIFATGDILQRPGLFLEATASTPATAAGLVTQAKVRAVLGDPTGLLPGPATETSVFDKSAGSVSDCFVEFTPLAAVGPTTGVQPHATLGLRFSEPMMDASLTPFDAFTITKTQLAPGVGDFVVGELSLAATATTASLLPVLPLDHAQGTSESYYVNIASGSKAPRDLAGNPLIEVLDPVPFQLLASAPSTPSGSIVLRFDDANEDGDVDGSTPLTEYAGQFTLAATGRLEARPVDRFSVVADPSQTAPGAMIALATGLQTPLSPLGSRMMSIYRYFDVGLSLLDVNDYNLDVEGLSWAPIGGQVQADSYEEFEIGLGHSKQLPDEAKGFALLPTKPSSGLVSSAFLDNVLGTVAGDFVTVHPKALGYTIDPAMLFTGSSGTQLMPYPLNQGLPQEQWKFFTWRDTSHAGRGGALGNGVPTLIEKNLGLISGDPSSFGQAVGDVALAGNVPTIGLPLLMEFKCYPSDFGVGLNGLAAAIAINSSPKPTFRIFSTGGFDTSGNPIVKNPDTETSPTGGFSTNPSSPMPLGAPTPPADNVLNYGQLDLVVRVSRTYTRWFDTGQVAPDYFAPVLEPSLAEQPAGTSIEIEYRGASSISTSSSPTVDPLLNADGLNAYGDRFPQSGTQPFGPASTQNFGIAFQPSQVWSTDVDSIDGARLVQVRLTLVANAATGETPELDSFGLLYTY